MSDDEKTESKKTKKPDLPAGGTVLPSSPIGRGNQPALLRAF